MEQLITGIAAKVGIEEGMARTAVGTILGMFAKEGPNEKVAALLETIPGASELVSKTSSGAATPEADPSAVDFSSGLGGMISGALGESNPVMETLAELQSQGLSVDQAMQVGQEVAEFAREKAGDDVVNEIASAIPGLSAIL